MSASVREWNLPASRLLTSGLTTFPELGGLERRFSDDAAGICTKHPNFFFGRLTPVEWAALMYQHLDHHLRQFGA